MALREEFLPEYGKLRIYLPTSLVGRVVGNGAGGASTAFGYWTFQPRIHTAFISHLTEMFGSVRTGHAGLYNVKNTILIFLLNPHGTHYIEISATADTAADIPYVASAVYAAIRQGARQYYFFG